MKTLLILVAAFALVSGSARAGTDLIYGPGGYINSLSRVLAKGDPIEQKWAAREMEWLDANHKHVNALMEWLRNHDQLCPDK